MPFEPWQCLPPGPAAVAIHDDRDMPRHLLARHASDISN
jgi:hypothetical protein